MSHVLRRTALWLHRNMLECVGVLMLSLVGGFLEYSPSTCLGRARGANAGTLREYYDFRS